MSLLPGQHSPQEQVQPSSGSRSVTLPFVSIYLTEFSPLASSYLASAKCLFTRLSSPSVHLPYLAHDVCEGQKPGVKCAQRECVCACTSVTVFSLSVRADIILDKHSVCNTRVCACARTCVGRMKEKDQIGERRREKEKE